MRILRREDRSLIKQLLRKIELKLKPLRHLEYKLKPLRQPEFKLKLMLLQS